MRKFVFGIIAVVCVQFAFVIYMKLESPVDLGAMPALPESQTVGADLGWVRDLDSHAIAPPTPEVGPIDPEHRGDQAALRPEAAKTNRRPEQDEKLRSARSRIYRPDKIVPKLFSAEEYGRSNPGGFETVVIGYNPNPARSPCDRPGVTEYRKRRLITHVASAVNSRWELIRSDSTKIY